MRAQHLADLADDAVQVALLTIISRWDNFKPERGDRVTYASAIVRNAALRLAMKESRHASRHVAGLETVCHLDGIQAVENEEFEAAFRCAAVSALRASGLGANGTCQGAVVDAYAAILSGGGIPDLESVRTLLRRQRTTMNASTLRAAMRRVNKLLIEELSRFKLLSEQGDCA